MKKSKCDSCEFQSLCTDQNADECPSYKKMKASSGTIDESGYYVR